MGACPSVRIAAPTGSPPSGRERRKTTNQKRLPFLLILLSGPLEEPENLESVEKTHGLGRSGIFQPMLLLSHDKPKKVKKKKNFKKNLFKRMLQFLYESKNASSNLSQIFQKTSALT